MKYVICILLFILYWSVQGKPPQDPPPELTEPANDLMTSDIDEFDGNDTESYIKEEVSFIDRLISSFQENSNKQGTPHEGLSVKQFTSLGETGYRRVPNGHKYGEFQVESHIFFQLEPLEK